MKPKQLLIPLAVIITIILAHHRLVGFSVFPTTAKSLPFQSQGDTTLYVDTVAIEGIEAVVSRVLVKQQLAEENNIILDGTQVTNYKTRTEYNIIASDTFLLDFEDGEIVAVSRCRTVKCLLERARKREAELANSLEKKSDLATDPSITASITPVGMTEKRENINNKSHNNVSKKKTKLEHTAPKPTSPPVLADIESYEQVKQKVIQVKTAYATSYKKTDDNAEKQQLLNNSAEFLEGAIGNSLAKHWNGKGFDVAGFKKKHDPRKVWSNYFVASLLEDAGFKLNKYKFAAQPAQKIVLSLCDKQLLANLNSLESVKAFTDHHGVGVYLLAFDDFLGILHNDGFRKDVIHVAKYQNDRVVRIPLNMAANFTKASNFSVGKLSGNPSILYAWLNNKKLR